MDIKPPKYCNFSFISLNKTLLESYAWNSLSIKQIRVFIYLSSCLVWNQEKVAGIVGAMENMTARAVVAIGWPGDSNTLPENYREKEFPSARQSLDKLMFNGIL